MQTRVTTNKHVIILPLFRYAVATIEVYLGKIVTLATHFQYLYNILSAVEIK